jgi:hypothetical protein
MPARGGSRELTIRKMEASEATFTAAAPVERPSWRRIVVLAGLAAVIGGFAIAGVEALLALTRLDGDADLLRQPASVDGGWTWLNYATKTALACWLLAWAGRRCVRNWTDGWDMRIWPVAVAIGIAFASLDRARSLTLAGFALVVVVARNVALARRPLPRWASGRWERIGLIAAIAVVAIVTLAYKPLNPLSAAFSDRKSDTSFSFGARGIPSRPYREFGFLLVNEGLATVTVRSIHADGGASADVDVLTHRDVKYARSFAGLWRPFGVEHIRRGDELHGLLRLSRASCSGPGRVRGGEVSALSVWYETLGFKRTAWLPIHPPARLRCPSRR